MLWCPVVFVTLRLCKFITGGIPVRSVLVAGTWCVRTRILTPRTRNARYSPSRTVICVPGTPGIRRTRRTGRKDSFLLMLVAQAARLFLISLSPLLPCSPSVKLGRPPHSTGSDHVPIQSTLSQPFSSPPPLAQQDPDRLARP